MRSSDWWIGTIFRKVLEPTSPGSFIPEPDTNMLMRSLNHEVKCMVIIEACLEGTWMKPLPRGVTMNV